MLKKILTLLMSMTLILTITACGSGISESQKQKTISEISGEYEYYTNDVSIGLESTYALILYEDGRIEHVSKEAKLDGKLLTGRSNTTEEGTWWIEKIEDEYVLLGSKWQKGKIELKLKYSYLNLTISYMNNDYHKVK